MIYLASPYSSPLAGAEQLRFEKVRRFAIHLFNHNVVAYSPIVYAHEMTAAGGIRTDAGTWLRFNSDMLRHSEAMYIYCLPGWKESRGVQYEVKQCKALFIPMMFFDEQFNLIVDTEALPQ